MTDDTNMPSIASIRFADLLDQVAARTPTPGGGAVSAVCGALASALARMVAVYSDKPSAGDEAVQAVASQLERAAAMLVDLADEDQKAYARYREANRRAKTDASLQHEANSALALCLSIPLEMCGVASQVLDVMSRLAGTANRHLLSDLRAAAILADAAVRAAGCFVRINADSMTERHAAQEVLATLERMEVSAAGRLAAVEATVKSRLQPS